MGAYGDAAEDAWFRSEYAKTGKKLDTGKSCIHFRRLEDVLVDLVRQTIARVTPDQFIARYEAARASRPSRGR